MKDKCESPADFLNSLNIVIPDDLRKDIKVGEFHHQLLQEFKNRPFTYFEVMVKLRITKSTLKRRLKPLLIRKLVIKLDKPETKKTEFVARENCPRIQPTPMNPLLKRCKAIRRILWDLY